MGRKRPSEQAFPGDRSAHRRIGLDNVVLADSSLTPEQELLAREERRQLWRKLSAEDEKALRMKFGIGAEDDIDLPLNMPDSKKEQEIVRDIQAKALQMLKRQKAAESIQKEVSK